MQVLHIVEDLFRRTTSDDFVFIFQVRNVGSAALKPAAG